MAAAAAAAAAVPATATGAEGRRAVLEAVAAPERGGGSCVLCCGDLEATALGRCDHPVCYRCSTKMRVLCEQRYCAVCREELRQVRQRGARRGAGRADSFLMALPARCPAAAWPRPLPPEEVVGRGAMRLPGLLGLGEARGGWAGKGKAMPMGTPSLGTFPYDLAAGRARSGREPCL